MSSARSTASEKLTQAVSESGQFAVSRAVKRNIERFPADFMFQLADDEVGLLRRHFGTSNAHGGESLRSQFGTSKGRGGRRYLLGHKLERLTS